MPAIGVNEGLPFTLSLILKGSEERLIPILMTALTAAFAELPLGLKRDVPGNEIERPMARVILGGLVTSLLLNRFLLPARYARWGSPKVANSCSRDLGRASDLPNRPITLR